MMNSTVEWSEALSRTRRTVPATSIRLLSIGQLAIGIPIVLLVVVAAVMMSVRPAGLQIWLGVLLLAFVGGLLVWQGVRWLRILRRRATKEIVDLSVPYAFRITENTLEFPGGDIAAAASWPRTHTMARVRSIMGSPALILTCTGRRPRRFLSRHLRQTPAEIVQALSTSS